MIKKETIDKIRDAANIVEVVGDSVTLRKAGINYKGLCPFHDDKKESFSVNLKDGRWYCFAEGRGGNFIDFIIYLL